MPYGISPMVIYYNTSSSTSRRWTTRGLDVPTVDDEDLTKRPTWTFEQFQAAAEYASRPRRGIAGFYVAPTLRGLAPFVYSGGGQIFDDDEEPTSLAFSSDDTQVGAREGAADAARPEAVAVAGDAVREDAAGVVPRGQARDDRRFPRPGAGAAADRRPRLRRDADAHGRRRGHRRRPDRDLHRDGHQRRRPSRRTSWSTSSRPSRCSAVAAAGYLAPANTKVALSDAFLQPGRAPVHARVFNNSVRNMRMPPLARQLRRRSRTPSPSRSSSCSRSRSPTSTCSPSRSTRRRRPCLPPEDRRVPRRTSSSAV